MEFNSILDIFFTWQTIILCLCIYLTTRFFRKTIENFFPKMKSKKIWKEVLLPLWPIMNGSLFGLCSLQFFPWPTPFAGFILTRMMYGAICGLFSGWCYNRVKSFLSSKTN